MTFFKAHGGGRIMKEAGVIQKVMKFLGETQGFHIVFLWSWQRSERGLLFESFERADGSELSVRLRRTMQVEAR